MLPSQKEKQKAENHHLFLPTPSHLNQPDRQILRWQATDFNGTDSGPSADTVTLTLRHASTLLERKIQVSASWHPSEASIFACQESFHPRNTWLGGRFKYFEFSSLFGELIQFDSDFSDGLKPPPRRTVFFIADFGHKK